MYILMKENYQFHIPTEDDRAWLEETLTNGLFTSDDAIDSNNWDAVTASATQPLKFSRIISRVSDNTRMAWMLSQIVNNTMHTYAVAIHPSFRHKRNLRPITEASYFWSFNRCPIKIESAVVTLDPEYVPKTDLSPAEFRTVFSSTKTTQTAVLRDEAITE